MSKLREAIENKIFYKERNLTAQVVNAKGYPGHHEFVYIVTIEQSNGKEVFFSPISWFRNRNHAIQCALDEYGLMKSDWDMDESKIFVDVQILND